VSPSGTPPSSGDQTAPGSERALAIHRVPALLVGHADFSRALLKVAEVIAGPVNDVPCLSNEGLSPEELTAGIRAELERLGLPVLLLVDVANGSCCAAARRATRGLRGTHLLTGVNLPLLLTYIQNRDRLGAGELVKHVLDRGRAGISCHQDEECG